MKTILFYSSVTDIRYFYTQKFYQIDIDILKELGFEVLLTNKKLEFIKFWKYSIAFLYFYKWSFLPAFFSRILGKHVYFTGGIDDLSLEKTSSRYKRQKILFRICYFLSSKCFIVSNNDLENVKKIIRNDEKLVLSLHTIDVGKFSKNAIIKKNNNFITIAWMKNKDNVIRKGIDRALYLFSEVIKDERYKDCKFLIAGTEGEGTEYLRTIIKEIKIENNVKFLGNIEENDKITLLNSTKYYFQLSEYEGFGLAALEALASGCIVVHSGRGGLKDCIGENGIKLDINSEIHIQKSNFIQETEKFSEEKIKNNIDIVNQYFNNKRRQEDFKVIK